MRGKKRGTGGQGKRAARLYKKHVRTMRLCMALLSICVVAATRLHFDTPVARADTETAEETPLAESGNPSVLSVLPDAGIAADLQTALAAELPEAVSGALMADCFTEGTAVPEAAANPEEAGDERESGIFTAGGVIEADTEGEERAEIETAADVMKSATAGATGEPSDEAAEVAAFPYEDEDTNAEAEDTETQRMRPAPRLGAAPPYTVSFISGDGGFGTMADETVNSNSYTLPDCAFTAPAGKDFAGWQWSALYGLLAPDDTITIDDDITLTAVWKTTAAAYTITYQDSRRPALTGEHMPDSVAAGETFILPTCAYEPPGAGYVFLHWQIDGAFAEKAGTNALAPGCKITPLEDMTLKAQWYQPVSGTTRNWKITYYANDGTNRIMQQSYAETGSFYLFGNPFWQSGFLGWLVDGVIYTPGDAISLKKDTDAYAIWDGATTSVLMFGASGGTGMMPPVIVFSGNSVTLPACTFTPPSGMLFQAWEIDGTEYAPGDSYTLLSDATASAVWKAVPPDEWAVTYKSNYPAGMTDRSETDTVTKGDRKTLKASVTFPAPAGMKFRKWILESDPTQEFDAGYEYGPVTGDTTFLASWEDRIYRITYSSGGGVGMPSEVYINGTGSHTLPNNTYINPGRVFDGWEVDGMKFMPGEEIVPALYAGDSNVLVIRATWKNAAEWTVIFHENGGSGTQTGNPATVTEGADYTLPGCTYTPPSVTPPVPEKTFSHWKIGTTDYLAGDTFKPEDVGDSATREVHVYAMWTDVPPEYFTVSFDKGGGDGTMPDVPVDIRTPDYTLPGSTFTPPAGQRFRAWALNGAEYLPGDIYTLAGDVTFTAIYEDIPADPKPQDEPPETQPRSQPPAQQPPQPEARIQTFPVSFYDPPPAQPQYHVSAAQEPVPARAPAQEPAQQPALPLFGGILSPQTEDDMGIRFFRVACVIGLACLLVTFAIFRKNYLLRRLLALPVDTNDAEASDRLMPEWTRFIERLREQYESEFTVEDD